MTVKFTNKPWDFINSVTAVLRFLSIRANNIDMLIGITELCYLLIIIFSVEYPLPNWNHQKQVDCLLAS